MKKIYLYSLAALALGLTACENYFDDKYMENGDPYISVVTTNEYILSSADYATIAGHKDNKAIAAGLDSIHGLKNRYQNALKAVGENECFSKLAPANLYVPAFLYSKYPQLDPGSIFNVTYLSNDGLPEYLQPYNRATQMTLDVQEESEIIPLLPQPEEGQVIGVIYDTDKEALFESKDGYVWQKLVFPADIDMHLLPLEANGQVENWLKHRYPYAVADQIVVVMWYDAALKHYVAYEHVFNGTDWIASTGIEEETMSFMLDAKKGWAANLSLYYRQALAGDLDQGQIVTQDFNLESGINYIWMFDSRYGMVANAYLGGAHYGEGWCVLPKIKLKAAKQPALSFDHAQNYVTDDIRYEQLTVWVSTDYNGDVRKAHWTQLEWNKDEQGNYIFPSGADWNYVNTGRIDLSPWIDQKINIGFRYKTNAGEANPKWEIKNILVNEPDEEEE